MSTPLHLLRRLLLSLVLSGTALGALAGPTSFHVAVNTTTLAGTGWLDFFFGPTTAAPGATATLSNFSDSFGAVDAGVSGTYASGPGGAYSLTNGPGFNYLSRMVSLGGTLSFDVGFSGAFLTQTGNEGSVFSVALFDQNGGVVGNPTGVATFDLMATSAATITSGSAAQFANVAAAVAVPEPAEWLLMMSGLLAIAFVNRRRAMR